MEWNNPNKIIILTTNPFPNGLAGTNRILSYCKGFLYHGYQPMIVCIRPTEPHNNIFNSSIEGTYNRIKYSYPGGTTIRVASFWGRRINDLLARRASIRLLFEAMKKREVFFVIFYGNCLSVEFSAILLSRLFKIGIYKEESEHPRVYFKGNNNNLYSLTKWFFINKMYRSYTGLLVMTNSLREYFLTKGVREQKILVVPHTVDIERFAKITCNSKLSFAYEYIAYLGPVNEEKDGVFTLVESFLEVSTICPKIHLVIAGFGTKQEIDMLNLFIKQLDLIEKVHYIGWIANEDIPLFLDTAKLLASCRSKSFQNEYNFPTKLIEYLATGKPTVTTAPGELTVYLKDRVNIFVAKEADRNSFASKILEVLQDYNFAMKVAQNGKELVRDEFNPIKQTIKIIDFCKD
jgi:glycosyltransferase involved in cell wall biosynthesis